MRARERGRVTAGQRIQWFRDIGYTVLGHSVTKDGANVLLERKWRPGEAMLITVAVGGMSWREVDYGDGGIIAV